ncbi:MAG: hypothetical protein IJH00_03650 [Erysipelotrichaceae bacterium]|nr:hypothetical protein [Erysipelotrichaceae bacterium]
MKKQYVFVVLFAIFMISILCSCGANIDINDSDQQKEESETQETIEWIEPEYIDFDDLLYKASEEHKNKQLLNDSLDENTKRIDVHLEDKNVISLDELNTLKASHNLVSSVSIDNATKDVDLLFRLLKYGYGGYYYFGGDDSFYSVRDNIISSIKKTDTDVISKNKLATMISENLLSIISDLHFVVDDLYPIRYHPERYSRYYYDLTHTFSKDDKGFYKTSDQNEKYYFAGFEKSNSVIEPTLLEDGNIAYSPVQFVKTADFTSAELIYLKGESGKEISEKVNWKASHAFKENYSFTEPCTMYYTNGELAYYSIKSFPFNSEEIQHNYVDKAAEANENKVIVMDIRSNGGGDTDKPIREWVKNYSGTSASINSLTVSRRSLIDDNTYEGFNPVRTYGNIIHNERPLIVLVDNMCGSNGETALCMMRCFENSLVIGTNSAGAQICGNQRKFSLPNSGITVRFGYQLNFKYDYRNVDFEGYLPDLWWDPSKNINSIFYMLNKKGYLEKEIGTDFMKEFLSTNTSQVGDMLGELKLVNQQGFIKEGESSTGLTDEYFDIMRNGSTLGTSDYEIGMISKGITVEKDSGKLHLVCKEAGQYVFELKYKDESHVFVLNVQ